VLILLHPYPNNSSTKFIITTGRIAQSISVLHKQLLPIKEKDISTAAHLLQQSISEMSILDTEQQDTFPDQLSPGTIKGWR
jgi:hypothetical protein